MAYPSIKRFLQTYLIFLTKTQLRTHKKSFSIKGYTWTIMKVSSALYSVFTWYFASSPMLCRSQGLMVIHSMYLSIPINCAWILYLSENVKNPLKVSRCQNEKVDMKKNIQNWRKRVKNQGDIKINETCVAGAGCGLRGRRVWVTVTFHGNDKFATIVAVDWGFFQRSRFSFWVTIRTCQ